MLPHWVRLHNLGGAFILLNPYATTEFKPSTKGLPYDNVYRRMVKRCQTQVDFHKVINVCLKKVCATETNHLIKRAIKTKYDENGDAIAHIFPTHSKTYNGL